MQLWIYTKELNNRKRYTFDFIFGRILGVSFKYVDDEIDFKTYLGPKISYHQQPLANEIHFNIHSFIHQNGISDQNFTFADWEGIKIPFAINKSTFSFDVFAATFFFLSRYEEYQIKERDEHYRFSGKNSLAYKNGFVTRPLIDEWAYAIADKIKDYFPSFEIRARKFQLIPTLDIDRAFYYQLDDFYKNYLKRLKLFLKLDFKSLKKDPFNVYEMVSKWDKKHNLNTIYFFLMGNKHEYDVALNCSNLKFRKTIIDISKQHQIGIHPSYFSHLNAVELKLEKQNLEDISSSKIRNSRQHYLLLHFPNTYRDLINAGINMDYTLAFADVAGFRASTCTPFFWYDLEKEEISELKIYPTAVMDQTLKKYNSLNSQQAEVEIAQLMQNVKKVNGTFISLWHNESINEFGAWKGWQKVYLKMLEIGSEYQNS